MNLTPKQKASELIKKFKDAQVKIKQSKEEAIASSILFIELLFKLLRDSRRRLLVRSKRCSYKSQLKWKILNSTNGKST